MVAQGIVALGGCNEIARDEFRTLVNQLVKGMLAVGAWFTPDNRAGLVRHGLAASIHVLAIAFHVALLEIGGKAMQVLIVWENGFCFRFEEVIIPDADQGQDHW